MSPKLFKFAKLIALKYKIAQQKENYFKIFKRFLDARSESSLKENYDKLLKVLSKPVFQPKEDKEYLTKSISIPENHISKSELENIVEFLSNIIDIKPSSPIVNKRNKVLDFVKHYYEINSKPLAMFDKIKSSVDYLLARTKFITNPSFPDIDLNDFDNCVSKYKEFRDVIKTDNFAELIKNSVAENMLLEYIENIDVDIYGKDHKIAREKGLLNHIDKLFTYRLDNFNHIKDTYDTFLKVQNANSEPNKSLNQKYKNKYNLLMSDANLKKNNIDKKNLEVKLQYLKNKDKT